MNADFCLYAGLAVLQATAMSYMRHWRFALFAHFRPHLAAVALAMALAVAFSPLPRGAAFTLAAALLVAAALHAIEVVRAAPRPSHDIPATAPRLRIAFTNVLKSSRRYARLVRWVRSESPDIFIAAEAENGWPAGLAELRDAYPHGPREPLGDLVIFSRLPVREVRHVLSENGHAALLEIETAAGPLRLLALHTLVPWMEEPVAGAYQLIADAAEFAARDSDDLVVVGDFNATPWCRPIRQFVRRSGLAAGPGIRRGSYPAFVPPWAGVPIDLAWARGCWRVARQQPMPYVGSDHRPIVVEIARVDAVRSP